MKKTIRLPKKGLTIFQIMGVALGDIGLSLSDFDALTLPEFENIYKAYDDREKKKT